MRKFFNHLVFILYSLIAFFTICAYLLPFLKPSQFSVLSVLSLFLPVLMVVNVLFFIYWLVSFKRKMLLSLFVLLIGYPYLSSLFKLEFHDPVDTSDEVSIMSFNARLFNIYDWIRDDEIPKKIVDSIAKVSPDIVCIQEYYSGTDFDLPEYQYQYIHLTKQGSKVGQAIYSKYPIVNNGSIDFERTVNNAIFADIAIQKDTVRVYNLHLQSLKITADMGDMSQSEAQNLVKRAGITFVQQERQMTQFLGHRNTSPFPVLIAADLNNTAHSYIYRRLTETVNDGFKEGGIGFGSTFVFRRFPLRIDFIFTDTGFQTLKQEVFHWKLSDHNPILAHITLR